MERKSEILGYHGRAFQPVRFDIAEGTDALPRRPQGRLSSYAYCAEGEHGRCHIDRGRDFGGKKGVEGQSIVISHGGKKGKKSLFSAEKRLEPLPKKERAEGGGKEKREKRGGCWSGVHTFL